jgi:hypothetical protein
MDASPNADVEKVHADLRRIPKGGPMNYPRLATLHDLRKVCRVDGSGKPSDVGKEVSVRLWRNIKTIRAIQVGGNLVPQALAISCLELTLGYDAGWLSLPDRRYRVLRNLGIPASIDQARREHSPEWWLLYRLAEHLVSTAA